MSAALVATRITDGYLTSPLRDLPTHVAKQLVQQSFSDSCVINAINNNSKTHSKKHSSSKHSSYNSFLSNDNSNIIITSNKHSSWYSDSSDSDSRNSVDLSRSLASLALSQSQVAFTLEAKTKKRAFVHLCKSNRKFLHSSLVMDGHVLAMCFVYFQRLRFTVDHYNNMNLYCALYLATACEEDSEEGIHELLCHVVGVSTDFPELDYTHVKRKCVYEDHEEWRKELHKFYGRVSTFWRALDYNAHVDAAETMTVQNALAGESSVFKPRSQSTLDKFTPFW